jgi:Arc/MetJ family transcription regulator
MADLPAYLGHLSTGRPALTPNDIRVMGAEATRVGRQVRDIPTDFTNAQSGLQKLDPITGQPTYGVKLQGVAESVGDIMAQREMQGLPPIPGLPASMQPMNPKLYAMRPEGSRLTSAVIPETSKVSPNYAVTKELISDVVGDGNITPLQTLEDVQNRYLRQPNAEDARDAFFNFLQKKAVEMYPDAPSPGEALDAYKARFSDKEASAPHTLQMYNEFLQTPEGTALAARVDMPTAEEITARHEAAVNWLNSQFTNYINEKVGTPNEPGIKLASQGLTYAPRGDVMESAHTTDTEIQRRREQAGMPALTATDKALAAANTQLQTLQQQAIAALTGKREQTQAAIDAGYGAPGGPNLGQFEPFAQASRAADKATAALDKQRKLVDNLQLGAAYENAIDTAVKATPAGELLSKIPYEERQFYPALQKTPKTENAYTASQRQLRNLGFDDMARKFYDDVMEGKIPLDKVPKMTVEKYIRSVAEPRVAKERAEQAAQADYKNAVDAQFKKSADAYIPNDKVFGNVGALEITNRFTPEEVAKLVSEDTTALDVCIGEGGIKRVPNLWHPGTGNRQYAPIYNVATGERNPDAPNPRKSYINAVRDGSQMVSFRDTVTGEPIAIFDFNPSSIQGKYNINFASGRANGKIKPEYIDGIKSYLNSRADSIHDIGRNIDDSAGIYDSKRTTNRELANLIDMPASQFERYDRSELPRFITRADLRNYIENLKANEPAEQVPAVMRQRPSESLESYVTGAVASAIDNVLDSQRRAFEEAGEGGRFVQADAFFESMRTRFEQDLNSGQNPVQALIATKQRLYDLESEYANSNRVSANIIADGIQDLINDLQGHINYAMDRQAAEEAMRRPRPFAQRAEPAPEARPDYLRMTHDATLEAHRDWGVQTASEVASAIRNITEQLGIDPANNTDAFIAALREGADVAMQGSAETILRELADRMESEYMRDWEPEEAPAAQQPFALEDYNRYVNELRDIAPAPVARDVGVAARIVAETNMGYNAWGAGLREQPIEFATGLLQQADAIDLGLNTELDNNPRTAQALREVAQQIMRRAQPPAPAAQQPFDFAGLVDGIVDEVSQNTNPGVGNRVETIAYRVAERTNPRLDPEGYAQALRRVITDTDHVAVGPALRALADRIYMPAEEAPAEPARMAYREPSQVEANVMHNGIFATVNMQYENLANDFNQPTAIRFANTINRLLSERGLNFEPTIDTIPDFGNALDGLRADIREQLAPLGREGFEGVAIANALRNMYYVLEQYVRDLEIEPARQPRGADLDNQRNDAIFQLENAVNDPELNPDDLRMMANGLSNPVDQTANSPWISLTDTERRAYSQELQQRANYIEFSPANFAIQLSTEAGTNIPELRDTIEALNAGNFDHEILRGLPVRERGSAEQRTAVYLNHILQGMQDDAGRRGNANEGRNVVPAEITDDDRDLYDEFNAVIRNAIRDEDFEPNHHTTDELADWVLNDEIGGLDDLTTEQRRRLSALVREYGYGGRLPPEGHADGGPVRGYQAGGSVKKPDVPTPWLFSVPTYSETVAYEMYPGQRGQDDQRDAARHMLAAGTLSRKYGPGVAEFMGKAHEYATSPLQAVKTLFGGQMPADYGMDTHNNAVGAQLGQRAKSQAELEDLVQAEAERASRTQTPGQAFIKKANGGIVQQNPTTDQMRYALMMRRK